MKNNLFNICMITVITAVINSYHSSNIKNEIQKHSIHPEYGNYVKVNIKTNVTCDPWDSCE